ncbi:MAG: ribbon-helix-helix protein, CopG family [Chloroflexi bacterium]|nr:ribbon-helix-helix protein, CopG family [Chloroflexota bacterium]
MALTKRVQLLLDPEQYTRLKELARTRKQSVSALIRRAISREYVEPMSEQKRAALDRLLRQETDFGDWEQAKREIVREVVRDFDAPSDP